MALNGLYSADVPLRNWSLTHSCLAFSVARVRRIKWKNRNWKHEKQRKFYM